MNNLTTEKRTRVVSALVEGNSIRATVRMTGVAKNTVVKLLADLGAACSKYQDEHFRNLPCRRVECDEIWSFIYAKGKIVAKAKAAPEAAGDVWTFTAIDAETKLVPSWLIGPRDVGTATEFMRDLASRLAGKIQLTTDGLRAYLWAVEDAFGGNIDFAQLQKIYGTEYGDSGRYSPPVVIKTKTEPVAGAPDPKYVSTSYIERQNLTMRMSIRRFTRLTNGFSKKLENHAHAIALHFMHYNFCRIHKTLRVTPAMAAGVSNHLWEIEEVVELIDQEPESAVAAG